MANKSRIYLKNVFKQNAVPTEQNFADLIDSAYNPVDDKLHLDIRGLVIGNDYKNQTAPDNGLLVQGNTQIDGGLSLGAGATITAFNNEMLGNSDSVVPTEKVVKANLDGKANIGGDSTVSFATSSLNVNGYLNFGAPANGSQPKVKAISTDKAFAASDHETLVTQQAIKDALDLKANLNGLKTVNFNTAKLDADEIVTKRLLITQEDYQVVNITVNNQLAFGNSHEYPVNKISVDGTFTEALDTTLVSQKAVKTYADTKANLTGDLGISFNADNLKLKGQFGFNSETDPVITKISSDATFASAANTTLATQKAIKDYTDAQVATKANLTGNLGTAFNADNLTLKGQFSFNSDTATVITKISSDATFANAANTTLATQKAIKDYTDAHVATKANLNGDLEVAFNANNLKLKGQFGFNSETDPVITKISSDAAFANATNTTLVTQKAIKDYTDAQLSTKANKAGDLENSFDTKDLTLKGKLKFNADTVYIDTITNSADFSSATDTTLPTQKAIKSYVEGAIADLALATGDSSQDFMTDDLSVNGQLKFGSDATVFVDDIKSAVTSTPSASALLTEAAVVSYVDSKVASSTGGTSSDARLKTEVQNLSGCLEQLMQLQGVSFEWISPLMPAGKQYGFIAQQVEEVIPELVHTGDDGYKSVAYLKFVAFLIEAIKEQQGQIDALRQDLATILGNK